MAPEARTCLGYPDNVLNALGAWTPTLLTAHTFFIYRKSHRSPQHSSTNSAVDNITIDCDADFDFDFDTISTICAINNTNAMDHLCPRLSFPLAPCMQCLSGSPPAPMKQHATSKRSNFIQSTIFPIPPKSTKANARTKPAGKRSHRSHRPKLSLQTRLQPIPQSQVMEELQVSLASFVLQQNEPSQRASQAPSVRSMRKDSATAPWLEPIGQVRANT
ncbi:hypothetical protein Q7P37_008898 [Cladosporium fusiforme]